jgi:hypothetical protein
MSKKNKKELPKVVWAATVNLSGCYSSKPIECKLGGYNFSDGDLWWDKSGNIGVRLGLKKTDGYTQFASEDKREVELFLMGVEACMSRLRDWSKKW